MIYFITKIVKKRVKSKREGKKIGIFGEEN